MSISVLIQARLKPEHVCTVLTALKEQLGTTAHSSPGRLRERIFQRLGSPGELISLSHWKTAEQFQAASPALSGAAVVGAIHEPIRTHHLIRLLSFERPLRRADVTACALILPTRGDSPAVRERVVQDRVDLHDAPGLISHEVYVTTEQPMMYVSLHSWRHLSDLQRFRTEAGPLNEQRLAEVGATLERFTGGLVAEYPLIGASG